MAGGRDTTGPVTLPLFLEPPDARPIDAAIVAAINTRSKQLTTVIKSLFEATGSGGDDIPEPEPVKLPIDRPAVNGSSLTFHAVHRSTHVSATRAAELNHAQLFAHTAIRTALTARNDMRNQLIQIADNAAGTLHKQNNATTDWNVKGPPMEAVIDSAAGEVIQVAENTNGTMHDAGDLVKSILNVWPDSGDPAKIQQWQREQVAIIEDLMRDNPTGSSDGMEPIPGKSPIESFRDSLDRFGGFMIVDGYLDARAPLNISSILPALGGRSYPNGAQHLILPMFRPDEQYLLDALQNGDPGPVNQRLDAQKTIDGTPDHNRRVDGIKTMLETAASQGYRLHAAGVDYGVTYHPDGTLKTWAEESRDIRDVRVPAGERYIVYGGHYPLTGIGTNPTLYDNAYGIPSYEVLQLDGHTVPVDGDSSTRVPFVNPDEGSVWYNVFTAKPEGNLAPIEPETEYIVDINPLGS